MKINFLRFDNLLQSDYNLPEKEVPMTIKEIARQAGVSIGTVDRVLHNRGRVSQDTIAKVKKIVKDSNYKPNPMASALSKAKEIVIGILMPGVKQDSGFWKIPRNGIKKAALELERYNIKTSFFYFNKYSPSSFKQACTRMMSKDIHSVLMAPVSAKEATFFLKQTLPEDIPCVIFDSSLPDADYLSYIGQDSIQSGMVAARLLSMAAPCGDIAVIRVVPEDYHIRQRADGFLKYFDHEYKGKKKFSCHLYDIPSSDDLLVFNELGESIYAKYGNDLSGIFITNDSVHHMAAWLIQKRLLNKPVLLGYDLIPSNIQYMEKNIIDFLISQHTFLQGYMGIKTLFKATVLKEEVEKKIMLPIDIITKENMAYAGTDFFLLS